MPARNPETTFVSGNVLLVPHTPSGAVTAGDVIVVGVVPFVAHSDIAANETGSISAGGGLYKGRQDGSLDSGGALVYWDDAEKEFVATGSSLEHFGYTLPDQTTSADQDEITVIHSPNRAPTAP